MSDTISASSATAPNRTAAAPEPLPLEALIGRARDATQRMKPTNPHRVLIRELAVAIVTLARMNADLMQQQADRPRIVLP